MKTQITHSNNEEKWRYERVKSLVDGLHDKGILKSIKMLHDHKGCLEVYWLKNSITSYEISIIKEAWENQNEIDFQIIMV